MKRREDHEGRERKNFRLEMLQHRLREELLPCIFSPLMGENKRGGEKKRKNALP
jgi:hypothetical protein